MRSVFIIAAVFVSTLSFKPTGNLPIADDPAALYQQYCGSCHGRKLESFRSRTWQYGSTLAGISAIIKDGVTDKGMPSYGRLLNEDQRAALSNYLLEQSKVTLEKSANEEVYSSAEIKLATEVVFTGADVPWDIESLPDSTLLISDRDGQLFHKRKNGEVIEIKGLPFVHNKGQGGLLDVCLHPNFVSNQLIFFSYSKPVDFDGKKWSTTAVCSALLKDSQLQEIKEIFEAKPYFPTNHHYGSRMAFDDHGLLYITVGDRGRENENPQNLQSDCGKVHRIKIDGSIPEDNPFYGRTDVRQSIFTFGHRNPQGIAYHNGKKMMWVNEHGPRGGDEVNLLQSGSNYGWPLTCYGINYDGTIITQDKIKEGINNPEVVWIPSIAPCDAVFVSSDLYHPWQGDFLVPSLSFGYLNRCIVKDGKVIDQEKLLEDIGRMRSIEQGSDGFIYIGLENPGKVIRIRPLW